MPSISAHTVDDAITRLRRERETGGDRYVPLRMLFEQHPETCGLYHRAECECAPSSVETLLEVGGRWDRRLKWFDGPADQAVVIRIHPGQRDAVLWFGRWIAAHRDRRVSPPAVPTNLDDFEIDTSAECSYSALFAGGRRAGKTWIGVAFVVAYAVAFPGSICWMASPTSEKHDELRAYMATHAAAEWIDHETEADGWWFCNGSTIGLKSGYNAEGLKEGRCDIALLNEGQQMKRRAFTVARGAIADRAGLVIVCANPPLEAKDERWVEDFAADAAAGRRAAVYLEFNPLKNPTIDRASLLSLAGEVDDRTFQIEVLGMFLGPADAVAYNWIRLLNERPVPKSAPLDCTEQFLALAAEGEGIRQVVGLDVQRFPYIGGPVYRFYGAPDKDEVIAWIVDEVLLEGGDEVDFCDVLRAKGYTPETTLIICDASGQYQHSRRRSTDEPPPEWKGRGSFDVIRSEGYRRIKPPDRNMKKNPAIQDRARAFTSMIATKKGVRRLFADPDQAPGMCRMFREWRQVHGMPSRTQDVAHAGDGASYVIARLFPRRLRSGKPRGVDPVAARVDQAPVLGSTDDDHRITAPTRGAAPGTRRGDRYRGM